ncbi:MAG: hypothetical protein RLZZ172_768 [Bacteroidota bacterium]|jgi:hypothetical protein
MATLALSYNLLETDPLVTRFFKISSDVRLPEVILCFCLHHPICRCLLW